MDKEVLLSNIDKVHTTEMGIERIKRNLKTDTDNVVEYLKNQIRKMQHFLYKCCISLYTSYIGNYLENFSP